jgi:galactokinase
VHELLASLFAQLPGATLGVFAPGRVNLIGEHTDYNGLPVLPFAIQLGIGIAVAPRQDGIVAVRSLTGDRLLPESIQLAQMQQRPRAGTWVDYVVAGLRLSPPPHGCDLLVAGDLPIAAGLSSSSALVVAAAMLFAADPIDRAALAESARLGEQYVGTLSGGMDQAASLLGQAGHALKIEFRPLRATPVRVPDDLAVVVADSGIRAEKGGGAQQHYNERVLQCAEAASAMGAPPGGLLADVPGDDRAARAARLPDRVLAARASFVFAEAARVDAALSTLRRGDLPALGRLVRASHHGLRDLYEVSHPTVDGLVATAERLGAFGARIVGAGFGGCCIALSTPAAADRLAAGLRAAGASQAFVVRPSAGAFRFAAPSR